MAAHAFTIKRGGVLYGTQQESGAVLVEAIYEPPQVLPALPIPRHDWAGAIKAVLSRALHSSPLLQDCPVSLWDCMPLLSASNACVCPVCQSQALLE